MERGESIREEHNFPASFFFSLLHGWKNRKTKRPFLRAGKGHFQNLLFEVGFLDFSLLILNSIIRKQTLLIKCFGAALRGYRREVEVNKTSRRLDRQRERQRERTSGNTVNEVVIILAGQPALAVRNAEHESIRFNSLSLFSKPALHKTCCLSAPLRKRLKPPQATRMLSLNQKPILMQICGTCAL